MAVAQRGPMSVHLSVKKLSWNWLVFFLELNMVWEVNVVLYLTELEFLKTIFLPLKMRNIGQAWGSLNV